MNPTTIAELHRRAEAELQKVLDLDLGDRFTGLKTFELADGSRRWATDLQMQAPDPDADTFGPADTDTEYTLRVTAPAPADAPVWARRYDAWTLDQLDGDGRLLATLTTR